MEGLGYEEEKSRQLMKKKKKPTHIETIIIPEQKLNLRRKVAQRPRHYAE